MQFQRRKPSPLAITAIILFVLSAILVSVSGFYADGLWFKSVDFVSVWKKILFSKVQLFALGGIITVLWFLQHSL